jgi:peptidoglycan hydrolase-like protein with peptidoglycan-binding domain
MKPPASRSVRLVRLAGVLLVVVVVPVVAVTQIGGGDAAGRYRAYFSKLRGPASESQALGSHVAHLLAVGPTDQIAAALSAAAQRQQLLATKVGALTPPPDLRGEQREAITAFQLRENGLVGLADLLHRAAAVPNAAAGVFPQQLAEQGRRLVAADVIWYDRFLLPVQARLRHEHVLGLKIPNSAFLTSPDEFDRAAMTYILPGQRTVAHSILKSGVSGPEVAAWQRDLDRWLRVQPGQNAVPVTGVFDAATTAATRVFQRAKTLTPDGIVGPATRGALVAALQGG